MPFHQMSRSSRKSQVNYSAGWWHGRLARRFLL